MKLPHSRPALLHRPRLGQALLLASLLTLGGCSSVLGTVGGWLGYGPQHIALRQLRVVAQQDANQDAAQNPSATQVDIVLVYSSTAQGQLPKTAPDWFARKQALQNGLNNDIAVVPLQLPPDTTQAVVTLPDNAKRALQIVAYARYFALPGQNLIDMSALRKAELRLRAQDVQLINLDN